MELADAKRFNMDEFNKLKYSDDNIKKLESIKEDELSKPGMGAGIFTIDFPDGFALNGADSKIDIEEYPSLSSCEFNSGGVKSKAIINNIGIKNTASKDSWIQQQYDKFKKYNGNIGQGIGIKEQIESCSNYNVVDNLTHEKLNEIINDLSKHDQSEFKYLELSPDGSIKQTNINPFKK